MAERTATRRRERWRRWTTVAAATALAAFHAELLLSRIADASLAEPEIALRWLASAALVGAGCALHRRRALAGGRLGLLLLAVLLVHLGGSPAPATPGLDGLLAALPAAIALASGVGAVAATSRLGRATVLGVGAPPSRIAPRRGASLGARLLPRPPPLLSPLG